MNPPHTWQSLGAIAPGGTVAGIAIDPDGHPWISSGAGIFWQEGGSWRPPGAGQPLAQVTALSWVGPVLFACGSSGEILYSSDRGEIWFRAWVGQTRVPVICLAASPRFSADGVLLAGTAGDGVLRTQDGGRSWRLSNAGLHDFSILALAPAPHWGRREIVFAGTAHGLYRSPNGGRAWKAAGTGLEGTAVLCLAVSPGFGEDGTVFAGTESNGLFLTVDGGRTWEAANLETIEGVGVPPVNALWLHPDFATNGVGLAGMADGSLYTAQDGGRRWKPVARSQSSILCLAGDAHTIYAGVYDRGLLRSDDQGQTWVEERPALRGITRLVRGTGRRVYAFGPLEGLWRLREDYSGWDKVSVAGVGDEASDEEEPVLLDLAVSPSPQRPGLLAGTTDGLRRSSDDGRTWQALPKRGEFTAVTLSPQFEQDGRAWAGTATGDLYGSTDGGVSWESLASPQPGLPLIVLAATSEMLVAATAATAQGTVVIWRSLDGGQTWQQWLQAQADRPSVQLGLEEDNTVACIGAGLWSYSERGWERVAEAGEPIVRLCRLPGGAGWLALTAAEMLYSQDGETWTPWAEGPAGTHLVDMVILPATGDEQQLMVLGAGGQLWRRDV